MMLIVAFLRSVTGTCYLAWTALRDFVIALTSTIIVLFFFFILLDEITRSDIEIDISSVPDSLVSVGLTPNAVAERLRDAVISISEDTSKRSELLNLYVPNVSHEQTFIVPGANLSVDSFASVVRLALGVPRTRFSGELVEIDAKYSFRLRRNDGTLLPITPARAAFGDIENLMRSAAEEIMLDTSPIVLSEHLIDSAPSRSRTIALAVLNDQSEQRVPAYTILGAIAFDSNPQHSLQYLLSALSLSPSDAELHRNLMAVYARLNDYKPAIDHLGRARKLGGSTSDSLSMECVSLVFELKRPDEGQLACFDALVLANNEVLRVRSSSLDRKRMASALNNFGGIVMERGHYSQAEQFYLRSIELNPLSSNAWANLGISEFKQGGSKAARAVSRLRQAIKLNPNYAAGHANLGLILSEQKPSLREAANQLAVAKQLFPGRPHTLRNYGNVLAKLGKFESAEASLEEAIAADSQASENYLALARVQKQQGRHDRAIRTLERAVRSTPETGEIRGLLGAFYYEALEFKKAIVNERIAVTNEPSSAPHYYIWGMSLNELGDFQQAISILEIAVTLDATKPQFHFQLAESQRELAKKLHGQQRDDLLWNSCAAYWRAISTSSAVAPEDRDGTIVWLSTINLKSLARTLGVRSCTKAPATEH